MKTLKKLFLNRSLKTRIIVFFTAFIFIVISLLTYLVYGYIFKMLKNHEHIIINDSLNYAQNKISFRIKNINQEFLNVFDNKVFQELYTKEKELKNSLHEKIIVESEYHDFFNDIRLRNRDILENVFLISANKGIYSDQYVDFFDINLFMNSDLYIKAMQEKNKAFYNFFPNNNFEVTLFRSFYFSTENTAQGSALHPGYTSKSNDDYSVLVFSLKKSYFYDILIPEREKRKVTAYIIDEFGVPIVSTGEPQETDNRVFLDILKKISSNNETFQETNIEGKKFGVYSSEIQGTGWKIVYLYDQNLLMKEAANVRLIAAFIFIISIVLVILIASLISSSVVNPIRKLGRFMDKALENNHQDEFIPKYNDEVAHLSRKFNFLLLRVSGLMKDIRKVEQQKRREELKALQAQINPHFLYNTLDTVYWMAMLDDNKKIAGIVSDLAGFFRLSLNKGEEITTVERELEHASKYMEIQKVRSGNQFDFTISADKQTLICQIPKLILQPLIENSVIHGFQGIDYHGEILIKTEIKDNILTFIVQDNGVGMEKSLVKYINDNQIKMNNKMGYAIANVIERITLYAGSDYGIKAKENSETGTCLYVTFPADFDSCKGDKNAENADC